MLEQIKQNVYKINKHEYLKINKGKGRIITPIKKDINKPFTFKNCDYFNLFISGGWGNLLKIAIIILLLAGLSWSYARDTRVCRDIVGNFTDKCIEALSGSQSNILLDKRGINEKGSGFSLSLSAESNDQSLGE